jgi:hypothetical protein
MSGARDSPGDNIDTGLDCSTSTMTNHVDIDSAIAHQQSVVDALDKALIPNTKDPALKALLRKVRPRLVTQLARKKTIRRLPRKATH